MIETVRAIFGRLTSPKAPTRKRVYGTIGLVLGVATLWGVITVDDADQLLDQADTLLGAVGALLARRHVNVTDDK